MKMSASLLLTVLLLSNTTTSYGGILDEIIKFKDSAEQVNNIGQEVLNKLNSGKNDATSQNKTSDTGGSLENNAGSAVDNQSSGLTVEGVYMGGRRKVLNVGGHADSVYIIQLKNIFSSGEIPEECTALFSAHPSAGGSNKTKQIASQIQAVSTSSGVNKIVKLTGVRISEPKTPLCYFEDYQIVGDISENTKYSLGDIPGIFKLKIDDIYQITIRPTSEVGRDKLARYIEMCRSKVSPIPGASSTNFAPTLTPNGHVEVRNITYSNGKCYAEAIVPAKQESGSGKEIMTKVLPKAQVPEPSINTNNFPDATVKPERPVSNTATGSYMPSSRLIKSRIEGGVISGILSEAVLVEQAPAILNNNQSQPVHAIAMKFYDILNPSGDTTIDKCQSFIPEDSISNHSNQNQRISVDRFNSMAQKKPRMILTHVRQADTAGVCLFRRMNSEHAANNIKPPDLLKITPEQNKIKQESYDRCQKEMSSFKDCACLAEKTLHYRQLSQAVSLQSITLVLKDECDDIPKIANRLYKQCMGGMYRQIGIGHSDESCRCLEANYQKQLLEYGGGSDHKASKPLINKAIQSCKK